MCAVPLLHEFFLIHFILVEFFVTCEQKTVCFVVSGVFLHGTVNELKLSTGLTAVFVQTSERSKNLSFRRRRTQELNTGAIKRVWQMISSRTEALFLRPRQTTSDRYQVIESRSRKTDTRFNSLVGSTCEVVAGLRGWDIRNILCTDMLFDFMIW